MNLTITKEKAEFNNSQFGSNKLVVVVTFPNCISTITNKPFKWMPTYQQLDELYNSLKQIETESWGKEND